MSLTSSFNPDTSQIQCQEQEQDLEVQVKEEPQLVEEDHLPPTKIRRQYKCSTCGHQTYNPRQHLRHRARVHKDRIRIVECPLCVYACQYRQKLNRHLKLVHNRLPDQLARGPSVSLYNYQPGQTMNLYSDPEDQPVDLSFPKELKQLIRTIESTRQLQQVFDYSNWTQMVTRQNGYAN